MKVAVHIRRTVAHQVNWGMSRETFYSYEALLRIVAD